MPTTPEVASNWNENFTFYIFRGNDVRSRLVKLSLGSVARRNHEESCPLHQGALDHPGQAPTQSGWLDSVFRIRYVLVRIRIRVFWRITF